jgi:Tfp pilus assembly protein PilX
MSTGAIVAIIVVVLVVVAALAVLAAANRRRRLRERFGPEYDRAVTEHDSKRRAEAELAGRERRVHQLNIRPLEPAARARYSAEWTAVQEQFVDAPQAAVSGAQTLIVAVMKDRGYPTEGYDQTVADLSVEHASTMDRFRAAHTISERAAAGSASTEDLRQAMVDYRSLFAELLGERAVSAPAAPDTAPADSAPADRAPADRALAAAGPAERVPATDVREPAATTAASDVPTRPDPADPAAGDLNRRAADRTTTDGTRTDETQDPAASTPVASRPQAR